MTTASAARTLDAGEKFFWMLDQVSCMNFVVFAELECQLPPATLQAALGELQRRHPLLNCGIRVRDAGHVAFYRTEPTPIRLSVQPVAADSWQEPLQAQLAQPFAAEEHPLARALYLPRSDAPGSIVGLVYHHAIADGRSGTALLREWLQQALTGVGSAEPAHAEPPPMHELFPPQFDWQRHPDKAAAIYGDMKLDIKRYGKPADLPWLQQQHSGRQPRFCRIELSPQQTSALLQQCRAHDTTLHGALGAAQLLAKRTLLADDGAQTLTLSHPADMRPYLAQSVPDDGLGLYITMLSSSYQVAGDSDFWQLAQQVVGDIRKQLQRGDGHLLYTLLRTQQVPPDAAGLAGFGQQMLASPKGSMISNIGRVADVGTDLPVSSISFALCPMPYQALFTAASSYGGKLILNINYDAAKLAPGVATRLAQQIRAELLARIEHRSGAWPASRAAIGS